MTIDINEATVRRSGFNLWLAWTLATAAGMVLGFVPFSLFSADLDLGLMRFLLPLLAGVLVGLLQWLALRPYLARSVDWVLTGGAGWAVGFALGLFVIQAIGGNPLGALLGYLLFGLIIGGLQWPVLRREIPNALAWVAASMVGWALGGYLSEAVLSGLAGSAEVSQVVSSLVIAMVTGLVAGAITGLALVWIVRQPDREAVRGA
jgi:NhaP-type Na+/H+ or K+/H+ antiporter